MTKKKVALTPEENQRRKIQAAHSSTRYYAKLKGINPNDPAALKEFTLAHCRASTGYLYPGWTATPTGKQVRASDSVIPKVAPDPAHPVMILTVDIALDQVSLDAANKELVAKLGTLDVHVKVDDKEVEEIADRIKKQLQEALKCEDVSPFEALWLIADLCKKNGETMEKLLQEVKKRGLVEVNVKNR